MKLFLDTANLSQIKEAYNLGLIEGVTTNPSLIAKEGRDFADLLREICEVVNGPVSAEVISQESEGMLKEARELSMIHPQIVIKIPSTKEGLKAIKDLSQEGIKTNCTLIFSPSQALLAAKVGANYVSPFIGRLDDISHTGMELVEEILTIYGNYEFETEVIVASVRNPLHVLEAALLGAPIVTLPFEVLEKLINHPLTDIGIERFLADWKRLKV